MKLVGEEENALLTSSFRHLCTFNGLWTSSSSAVTLSLSFAKSRLRWKTSCRRSLTLVILLVRRTFSVRSFFTSHLSNLISCNLWLYCVSPRWSVVFKTYNHRYKKYRMRKFFGEETNLTMLPHIHSRFNWSKSSHLFIAIKLIKIGLALNNQQTLILLYWRLSSSFLRTNCVPSMSRSFITLFISFWWRPMIMCVW